MRGRGSPVRASRSHRRTCLPSASFAGNGAALDHVQPASAMLVAYGHPCAQCSWRRTRDGRSHGDGARILHRVGEQFAEQRHVKRDRLPYRSARPCGAPSAGSDRRSSPRALAANYATTNVPIRCIPRIKLALRSGRYPWRWCAFRVFFAKSAVDPNRDRLKMRKHGHKRSEIEGHQLAADAIVSTAFSSIWRCKSSTIASLATT